MIRQYENKNTIEPSANDAINHFCDTFNCVYIPNDGTQADNITLGFYTNLGYENKEHAKKSDARLLEKAKEAFGRDNFTITKVKLKDIQYNFYNLYNQKVPSYKPINIEFTDNSIIIDGVEVKILEKTGYPWVFKRFKKYVKVADKTRFIEYVANLCNAKSVWNTCGHSQLLKIKGE